MSHIYSRLSTYTHTCHPIRVTLFALPLLLCLQFQVFAGSLNEVIVSEKNGIYNISVIAEIAATEKHVRQVLTDYVHIYRLSDSIIESKIVESSITEKTQVETLVLGCTPIFCKEVTRVEEVSTLETGDIQTVIVPEKSDFRSGKALWEITARGEKTELKYLASLEPDFFIPPVLGTQMVINNLRDEFETTLYRLGHIARINEAREWDENFSVTSTPQRTDDGPCDNESYTSMQ